MTIEKFDPIWAKNGDKGAAIPDSKKEVGWVGGDTPTIEKLNRFQNTVETTANDLVEYGPVAHNQDMTKEDWKTAISTGRWPDAWGTSVDDANIIDRGVATTEYVDLAVAWDSDNEPLLIALDQATQKIDKFNPRTLALVDSSADLTAALGAGTWDVISMCTDGTSAYVVFHDTVGNTYKVQAFNTSDWLVKTGWPAAGTSLPGSGTRTSSNYQRECKIIVANATHLATSNGWNLISTSSSAAVSIISMATGAISGSGAGDSTTGTYQADEGICSDGTNIYFVSTAVAGTPAFLSSLQIASPITGGGGTNYPFQLSARNSRLLMLGDEMLLSYKTDTSVGITDFFCSVHTASDAQGEDIITGAGTYDKYIADGVFGGVFDGANAWLVTANTTGAGPGIERFPWALKFDGSKFSSTHEISAADREIDYLKPHALFFSTVYPFVEFGHNKEYPAVAYDGRDLWLILDERPSQSGSGKIARIPAAKIRG